MTGPSSLGRHDDGDGDDATLVEATKILKAKLFVEGLLQCFWQVQIFGK